MSKGPTLESSASARISAEGVGRPLTVIVAVAWRLDGWQVEGQDGRRPNRALCIRPRLGLSSAYIADHYLLGYQVVLYIRHLPW